jgi:hypothetical protein
MSRDGSIDLDFADGTYHFRLAWGELVKLQEECNAGPYFVLNRLLAGQWRMEDITSVIRLGLIGGGMDDGKAMRMVRTYVESTIPFRYLAIAQRVLGAAVVGTVEEDVGKKAEAASQESPTSQTGESDLPPSTETAQ